MKEGGVEATVLKKVIDDETDKVKLQGIAKDLLDRNAQLHQNIVEQSVGLSAGVLILALIAMAGLCYLFLRKTLSESAFYRLFILSMVIAASLFLIVAGFGQEQITPVIGLLGTITGYILGKQTEPPLVRDPGGGNQGQ